MALVALGAYVILFCMTFWVIKVYNEESAKINKRLRTR
jgi:hypothetical protein